MCALTKKNSFKVSRLITTTFTSLCQCNLEELGVQTLVVAMGVIITDDDNYYDS
jgi:hypothetical protein